MHLSFILGMLVVVAILIVAIVLLLVKKDTKEQTENMKKNEEYISMSVELIRKIHSKTQNELLRNKAEQICDMLQASPRQSREDIKVIEEEILNKLSFLDIYISEQNEEVIGAKMDEIQELIKYRNESLK